jgi:membrane protein required for colicin V production
MVFDLLFILLFVWAAYKGFTKGLILQMTSLAALFLGIYGAIKFSYYISNFITDKMNVDFDYLPIISFALTFVVIVVAIHFLGRIIEKIIEIVALSFINRLFGAIFNIFKYALIISVFLVILGNFDRRKSFLPKDQIQKSLLFTPIYVLAPFIYPYLRYNFFPNLEVPDLPVDEIPV